VNENFQNSVTRRNAEGLIGEKLGWVLNNYVRLAHQLSFYPRLTNAGAYRFDSTTTLSTRISTRLSFNTSFTDHYLSLPLPGHQKNESVLTAGLGFNF
jgi:hypothetical protein